MKLHTIFTSTLLISLTSSCSPPFNNPKFIGNATHSSSNLIKAALKVQQSLGRRWVDAVDFLENPAHPWPQDGDTDFHVVRYCFADQFARDNLQEALARAIAKWTSKIGPSGKKNRHALVIEAHPMTVASPLPFCWMYNDTDNTWIWNPMFEADTLIVQELSGGTLSAKATMGHTANNLLSIESGDSDRKDVERMAVTLAHELGHVFGLFHEHQRADRDIYLSFNCSNLQNYYTTRDFAASFGIYTMDQICHTSGLEFLYKDFGSTIDELEPNYAGSNNQKW